ncbi:MAG: 5-dehydro-4-deoxy-D-glucuronate isomerase [Firmicutes bacterium]|nr:5-dehydro-4-deoxy-D-glucuronate isomerase [Bacillota bacterium]
MEVRYSASARDFKRYTTEETRNEFLIEEIFQPEKITAVYSHVDRIITMGAMPLEKDLILDEEFDSKKDLGQPYFLASREMGVINVGGHGAVVVDGTEYAVDRLEGLYIPVGTKEVIFKAFGKEEPPKYYISTVPAHHRYEVKHITIDKAHADDLGEQKTANARIQRQYIHPSVCDSCCLLMGVTSLKEGSVWNTMPPHLHDRRMEVYMYFDVKDGEFVSHFMGEPKETRHIIVHNEQAVISPSWSIHSGCGTSNFSFVWAMTGENKDFDDMERLEKTALR